MSMFKRLFYDGLKVGGIMAAGDLVGQKFGEKKTVSELDLVRTMKFASIGLFLVGPVLTFFYDVLDKKIAKNQHPLKKGIKKMLIDQTCMAPSLSFIITCFVLHMKGEPNIRDRVLRDYPEIMLSNYKLWPAVQTINFTLTPVKYQVIVVQLVAVFWNAYVSIILNRVE